MNAKRCWTAAIALGIFCIALLASSAQAQEFRGFTCEGLLEHIRAGGHVIFEETNRWYYSHCPRVAEDDEDANAPANRRTVATCPQLPPRVTVFGYVEGTQCRMVGAAGVGREDLVERGVIDAVDIWSYVNGGLEVCFRNRGALVFLDAAYAPRMLMELAAFQRDGMTCGKIDRAGTVVLLHESAPNPAPPADDALPVYDAIPTSSCLVKLEETLFLRAEPAGEIIGLAWLYSEVPVYEISGDWYKTEFEGKTGYISSRYSRVVYGGCV